MTEHDTNLRDLASMFAMAGLIIRNREGDNLAEAAHDIADQWMEARQRTRRRTGRNQERQTQCQKT
jgi:hypothetical protein